MERRGEGPSDQSTPPARPFAAHTKVRPGDRVAIVSPSWAGPGMFPLVHEIALKVLRDDLGLGPVEYPTTRQLGATPQERARDLQAAFADPTITAVLATIGGDDQLTVLPYLDPEVIRTSPKPFFGYSDNTNLLNWLWNLGIVSYHGGSTMVHLARPGGPHPVSMASLRSALFTNDAVDVLPVASFTDLHGDWADPRTLESLLETTPEPGWRWHNATSSVTGRSWGGNLEILHWNLAAGRWIRPNDEYRGCVLILETSEEMPSGDEVFRMLRNMGERGLLEQFGALVYAKPKAWDRERRFTTEQRERFREDHYAAVLRATARYNPDAMVLLGPDFGHTDPQVIIPIGGVVSLDGPARRFRVTY